MQNSLWLSEKWSEEVERFSSDMFVEPMPVESPPISTSLEASPDLLSSRLEMSCLSSAKLLSILFIFTPKPSILLSIIEYMFINF